MSNIESTRSNFFPKSKNTRTVSDKNYLNGPSVKQKIKHNQKAEGDAKITFSDAIKDFNIIKKAVDSSPVVDQSEKIERLRKQIASGNYEIDYDALADKIISQEL